MAAVGFDTLKIARRLRDAGLSEVQADALTEAIGDAISMGDLATKADVAAVRSDLNTTKAELKAEIAEVKADILNWMYGALIAQGALVVTLIKLLPGH